jgi:hypothetical protein
LVQAIADKNLPASFRERIKTEWLELETQKKSLEDQIVKAKTEREAANLLQIDSAQVREKLQQLPEVFSAGNVTRSNVELALYIDKITVAKDGTVKVRIFKPGFLGHQHGDLEYVRSMLPNSSVVMFSLEGKVAQPRRRTLRDIEDLTSPDSQIGEKSFFTRSKSL